MTKNKENSNNWDVDEHGLPLPKRYDAPPWDVREYLTDTYAEAKTLGEAIEMRGQDAFAHEVDPADFSDDGEPFEKLRLASPNCGRNPRGEREYQRGISNSNALWQPYRQAILLKFAHARQHRTNLASNSACQMGNHYPTPPTMIMTSKYLNRAFKGCRAHEHLVCRVRSVECYGGNNDAPVDPLFCWRVYTCKVTVFRRNWGSWLN